MCLDFLCPETLSLYKQYKKPIEVYKIVKKRKHSTLNKFVYCSPFPITGEFIFKKGENIDIQDEDEMLSCEDVDDKYNCGFHCLFNNEKEIQIFMKFCFGKVTTHEKFSIIVIKAFIDPKDLKAVGVQG